MSDVELSVVNYAAGLLVLRDWAFILLLLMQCLTQIN